MTVKEIFSLDYRSLALFRISVASVIIIDTLMRYSLVDAFYTDQAILTRDTVRLGPWEHAYHFQALFLSGQEWLPYILFSLLIILSVFLLVGYKSRVSAFFIWLIFCSIIVRDPLTSNSGDILLIVVLFWSMFLPMGRTFSIDALKRNTGCDNGIHFSVASVGIYVQFALVYIITGLHKGANLSWREGSHLYLTFSRFEYVDPTVFLIYEFPGLLNFLTHAALHVELFAPFLFFIPFYFFGFRMIGISLLIGLQVSILLFMDVGMFSYVSIASILVFLPSQFWELSVIKNLKGYVKDKFGRIGIQMKIKEEEIHNSEGEKDNLFSTLKIKPVRNSILSILILYICVWNIDNLSKKFTIPEELKWPVYYLKLDQKWRMFATPAYSSEYYTLDAVFKNGQEKNLLQPYQHWYKTDDETEHVVFKYNRWRKFFVNEIKYGDRLPLFSERIVEYFVSKSLDSDEKKNLKKVKLVEHSRITGRNYDHTDFYGRVLFTKEYK